MKRLPLGAIGLILFSAGVLAQTAASPEALLKAAQQWEQVDGDLARAAAQYQLIVDRFPMSSSAPEALLRLSRIHERRGDVQRAADGYKRILSLYPSSGSIAADARDRLTIVTRQQRQLVQQSVLAGEPANEIWSHVSPDGRLLAYCDSLTGNLAVWDIAASKGQLVTTSKGWQEGNCEFSAWSPDGGTLAYSWWNGRVIELRIASIKDGRHRVLLRDESMAWLEPLSWAPDGKSVLVHSQVRDPGPVTRQTPVTSLLHLVSVSSGDRKVVRDFGRGPRPDRAMFSPDGRFIAFDFPPVPDSPQQDIHILSVDGRSHWPLITDPAHDGLLGWSPRSDALLFFSDREGNPGAWLVDVVNGQGTGRARLVKADIGQAESMSVSRSGTLFFNVTHAATDVFVATLDPSTGAVVDNLRPLPRAQAGVRRNQGTWAPDGDRIAFLRSVDGQLVSLQVLNTRTGAERGYPLPVHNVERPSWFPDGRAILVEGRDRDNQNGVFKLDLETGSVELYLRPGLFPHIAPDGRFLIYRHGGSDGQGIWKRDLPAGTETRLIGAPLGAPVLSPDGRFVGMTGSRQADSTRIVVFPTSGGEARLVVDHAGANAIELAWGPGPNGGYLYYSTGPSPWQTWRVSATGGNPQKLDISLGPIKHISASPDGRRIAISGGTARVEIFKLENISWAGVR